MIRPGGVVIAIGYATGLATIAWIMFATARPVADNFAPDNIAMPEFDAPPPAIQSLDSFAEIIERPLFQAGRKMPAETATVETLPVGVETTSTQTRLDRFRLSAIFSDGDIRQALVELPNGESLTVGAGDQLQNWRVVEIRDQQLVLGFRGQQQTLDVHDLSYLAESRTRPRERALNERAEGEQRANRRQPGSARPPNPAQRQRRRDDDDDDDDREDND